MRGEHWNIEKPDENPRDETGNQLTSCLTQKFSKTPEAMGSSWTAEFLQPSEKSPMKTKLQWRGSFPVSRCKLNKEKVLPEELSHLGVGRIGSHSHGITRSPLSPGKEHVGKQIPAVWRGWMGRSHGK